MGEVAPLTNRSIGRRQAVRAGQDVLAGQPEQLRHPVEVPFFIIVVVIVRAASVPSFLPGAMIRTCGSPSGSGDVKERTFVICQCAVARRVVAP
jgi:hypothetical protein